MRIVKGMMRRTERKVKKHQTKTRKAKGKHERNKRKNGRLEHR